MVKQHTEIVGIEQLHTVLDQLPKRLNKKLLGQATRKSAKPIVVAAKGNVSQYSKEVAKQVKVWALKRSPRAGVWVGWRIPKTVEGTRAERAWKAMGGVWLEYGTSGHGRTSAQRKSRRIPAIRWFRRAVDMNIKNVEKDFKKDLSFVINRFLDKAITKYGW